MSYFDENEHPETDARSVPEEPIEENASPEAEAAVGASEEETADTAQEKGSEAGAEPESGSVSYGPSDRYTPHVGGYYQAPSYRATYAAYEAEKQEGMRRMRRGVLAGVLAIALLCVTLFGGVLIGRMSSGGSFGTLGGGSLTGGAGNSNASGNKPTVDRGSLTLNVVERESGLPAGSIPAVVAAVKDSVVEIRTETTVNSPYYGEYVESGAGSGVIISEDGLILTCAHVIEGGDTVHVVLTDGSTYIAEVYGTDSWSDLALLHIEATDLPYARLAVAPEGNEDAYSYMAVGEGVVAIGNPLGELGGSVTAGIISALGRSVTVEGVPMTLMQIDASVNPGNSGGGLFNMDGDLIGIVNAKSTGESIEGIGFAIPSSDALGIVSQLYRQGYVSGRPYLGLYMSGSLQIQSYEYNDELPEGNRIQSGDVLYSADGKVLSSSAELRTVLAGKQVGDTVDIKIVRYVQSGRGYVQTLLDFTLTVHEYVPDLGNSEEAAG